MWTTTAFTIFDDSGSRHFSRKYGLVMLMNFIATLFGGQLLQNLKMTTATASGFMVMTLISVIVAFIGLCLDIEKLQASIDQPQS